METNLPRENVKQANTEALIFNKGHSKAKPGHKKRDTAFLIRGLNHHDDIMMLCLLITSEASTGHPVFRHISVESVFE